MASHPSHDAETGAKSNHAPRRALVLLSGGLDSATTLAFARDQGFACHALTVRYGQRHAAEVHAAERIARDLHAVDHVVIDLDSRLFAGSALTDDVDLPRDRSEGEIATGIPVTYVPARNLVFLSLALARAEAVGARDLFLGVNAVDYSGYPDCRPAFIRAFESTADLATRAGAGGETFRVHTPLIDRSKAEIVRLGMRLGVDFASTVSCYDADGDGRACGRCDSCLLRRKGFADAGAADPTRYQAAAPARP